MKTALDIWYSDLKFNWKRFLSKKKNIVELIVCIIFFLIVTTLFQKFLPQFELIHGAKLDDILLRNLPAFDVSCFIFVILYTVVFYNYLFLFAYPRLLVSFFLFYTIALFSRFCMLFFVHLEAPNMIHILFDPILAASTYNNLTITKDLFFSGHMVTIFCNYMAMPNKTIRTGFLISSIVLGVLILIQHAHYTIDLLGAYIFVMILNKVYYQKVYRQSKFSYQYSSEIINV